MMLSTPCCDALGTRGLVARLSVHWQCCPGLSFHEAIDIVICCGVFLILIFYQCTSGTVLPGYLSMHKKCST